MALWTRDFFKAEGDEDAGVGLSDFSNALSIFVAMNDGKRISVRAAAEAFNTTDDIVMEAVEEGYWMSLSGPTDDCEKCFIELDGE